MIQIGTQVIYQGEVYNIKITTLHDLKLSNAILVERTKE